MSEVRRLDSLERTVRDTKRAQEDAASTILARLGTHVHRTTNQDVEITDATKGVVLKDRTTGNRYRLFMAGGVLSTELA